MLQNLRENIQGWIAGVIVGLLSIAFALWGIEYYIGGSNRSDTIAKVNGKKITQNQFHTEYERFRQNYTQQFGIRALVDPTTQAALKNQVLDYLIQNFVLMDAALAQGYRINPEQVSAILQQIPAFQVKGQFSLERFQQVLSRLMFTENEFLENLKSSLLIEQVGSGIVDSDFALLPETESVNNISHQKRDLIYVVIPVNRFLNQKASPTLIQDYYQKHQEEFKNPAKVRIEYIELSIDDLKNTITVTEQELKDYYHSEGQKIPFEKIRSQLAEALKQQKAEKSFSFLSDRLSDLTFTNPDNLTTAAKELGLTLKNTDFFTRKGTEKGITNNPRFINTAFSEDVLKGNNSNLIEIKEGHVIVLRVKQYDPETVKSLSEVQSIINQRLLMKDAEKQAKTLGISLLDESKNINDFKELMKKHKLEVKVDSQVSRNQNGLKQEIISAGFELPKPTKEDALPIVGVSLPNGDYALVALMAVQESIKPMTKQERTQLQNVLKRNYGQLAYHLYIAEKINKAKIKIIENNITRNSDTSSPQIPED